MSVKEYLKEYIGAGYMQGDNPLDAYLYQEGFKVNGMEYIFQAEDSSTINEWQLYFRNKEGERDSLASTEADADEVVKQFIEQTVAFVEAQNPKGFYFFYERDYRDVLEDNEDRPAPTILSKIHDGVIKKFKSGKGYSMTDNYEDPHTTAVMYFSADADADAHKPVVNKMEPVIDRDGDQNPEPVIPKESK